MSLSWAIPHQLGQFPKGTPPSAEFCQREFWRAQAEQFFGKSDLFPWEVFYKLHCPEFHSPYDLSNSKGLLPSFPEVILPAVPFQVYPLIFSKWNFWEFLNLRDLGLMYTQGLSTTALTFEKIPQALCYFVSNISENVRPKGLAHTNFCQV